MESNSLEVNDNEVPLKTDHNQSDNGLDMSRGDESPSNSQMTSIDGQICDTNDESDQKDNSKDNKSSDDDSRHQYSKEQLIQISKLSSARVRPKCLDNAFNNSNNGLWNPEKWISSRSPAATASNKYNYNKRPNNDLKDRVLEEENEIILSPQRGSFGTGCHVSSNSFASNRGNDSRSRDHFSERNKMDESGDGSHRSNTNTRRVGSGRIVAKERDRPNDWTDRNYDRAYEHRDRDQRENRDNRNDDYNDRRSGRYDRRPNRDMNSNRNIRFESERYRQNRYSREEEENEPEWFTEGPTSKHDTIELKGFDDDTDLNSKNSKNIDEKSKDNRNKDLESNAGNQIKSEQKVKEVKDVEKEVKSEDFDVNEMFKTEDWFTKEYQTPENKMISSSVGISDNVNNESDSNVKSRFKRWFKESPNPAAGSTASELPNFSQINDNIRQKEGTPSMIRPSNTQMSNPLSPEKIFELLSNGSNRLGVEHMSHQKLDPSKAMSLADIEANLSQMAVNSMEGIDDKRAFDKLIFDLNKKSTQNSNSAERHPNHSQLKGETTLVQTPDAHVIIPKSMRIAPSILELLKEQENKEAMADLHRNNRRVANQMPSHPNGSNNNNVPQVSVNNSMFGTHSLSNAGPTPMEVQNWQNCSSLMKSGRPSRNPSNQEMSEHTSIMLQKALQTRQPIGQLVRPQSQAEAIRANTPNRSVSNFLIPTSVMRNMHSDKDRDSVKSVLPFNDMTPESNSSQFKYPNDFISKPSPMRPIVKSNNPIGQSIAKQSPLSPHSDSMAFSANSLAGIQSHLFLPQQTPSPVNAYQRPITSSNASHPFNLGQNSMTRTSSPSAVNNIAMNSNPHIHQMFNNSNVRTSVSQMQMNQMMALQHNSVTDGRQSQYSQSRPITATNVQQMLFNNSKTDPFNSFNRMSDSEGMKTMVPTTYSQPRPQMQQTFQNSGPSQSNRNTEPRFFGQIFGEDALHHSMPELPTVPLHNALTLDDIERS